MKKIRKTSYLAYSKKSVPYIRLSGRWLEKIGFSIGSKFQVNITEDEIAIRRVNHE